MNWDAVGAIAELFAAMEHWLLLFIGVAVKTQH